jgi:hypothetical protein
LKFLYLWLPFGKNEKETIDNRNLVHAGVEASTNAGIFFVPEELHR